MKKMFVLLLSALLILTIVGSFSPAEAKKVKLEFFQNKREAVNTFNQLIEKFEKENPDIEVEQNFSPDAGTVIKTRLVKNDLPDIMALNGSFTFGELARAGVLYDFTKDAMLENLQEAYVTMINQLTGIKGNYGIPYSANANTVLYNKEKFKAMGLKIPKTWDEFIAICEKIKAAGETPLYLTLKDAWTAMVPFNSMAANLQGDDFFEKRKVNQTTFAERYIQVGEKMLALLNYGHNDNFGFGYGNGNTAFANGKSFLYIQGIWAISSITSANPDIQIGVFALPVLNDASKNRLVSGVDTVLAISNSTRNPDAAKKFIEFLLKEENAQYYIDQQKLYSAVKGVYQEDAQLNDIKEYFESGRITSFPDHYYPAGMQASNLVQEFLINKDIKAFLKILDNEWDKVTSR
ncbi:MAG: extracellular solute-binding protein [Halanaerobiales bacterium]|nr:extracellular solute-binding protein [Halanaerobiales bacterium]